MYVYTALADIIHILLSGSEAELPDGCLRTPRVLKIESWTRDDFAHFSPFTIKG